MSICVSAGRDPATTSIRQYCLDGSYDYLETTYGPMEVASLIAQLGVELARMHQYARSKQPLEQHHDGDDRSAYRKRPET
jgi:hypothetical protein